MQLDDKAISFMKQAKASGASKEEVFNFLRAKGYDLEQEKPIIGEKPEQFAPSKADVATSALKGFSFGLGNPLMAGIGAATEKIQGSKEPFMDLVGQYGQAIEDRQAEFAQKNPKTQFAAELSGVAANLPVAGIGSAAAKGAGQILSKLAPRAASNILAKGAVEGAAFGLPYTGLQQGVDVLSDKKTLSQGILGATKDTLTNAALGGVIPLTGRGIAKIIGTRGEQGRQAAKILNKAGDKSIESIVRTDKGTVALKNAIRADNDLAAQIRDIADEKIINSADKTADIIRKDLGFSDIQQAKQSASDAYKNMFEANKTKIINGTYRGEHKISKKYGTTLDNLQKIAPKDFFTNEGISYYGSGNIKNDSKIFSILKKVQNNPQQKITVYRNVPQNVKEINSGDWITLSKEYAINHNPEGKVLSKKVKVSDIFTDGNDIYEQAYFPKNKKSLFNNPIVKQALDTAKKQDLLGEMAQSGDNSLLAAQRTKEVLDEMIQRSKVTGDFGKQQNTNLTRQLSQIRNNFIDKVDEAVPEYKSVRKAYQQAKQSSDLIDKLLEPVGRERSNTISSVLTNENKQTIADVYGQAKANRLFEELRKQSVENKRFSTLYNEAEGVLTKATPKETDKIASAVGGVRNIIGTGLNIATLGRSNARRKGIANILLGNKPMPQAEDNISKQFIRGAIKLKAAKGE